MPFNLRLSYLFHIPQYISLYIYYSFVSFPLLFCLIPTHSSSVLCHPTFLYECTFHSLSPSSALSPSLPLIINSSHSLSRSPSLPLYPSLSLSLSPSPFLSLPPPSPFLPPLSFSSHMSSNLPLTLRSVRRTTSNSEGTCPLNEPLSFQR